MLLSRYVESFTSAPHASHFHASLTQYFQIRTIYRVIEFALGINGYPFSHEWCLYVLEGTPMWIALGVLALFHPVKWLQQKPRSEFESTEPKGQVQRA